MIVYLGPYPNWIGPYQIAEKILFWKDPLDDQVMKLGDFLAHANKGPDHETWLLKICRWIESKKKRTEIIKLHKYDSWNANHTIALIAYPLLVQLKATQHGSPHTDDSDAPPEFSGEDKLHQRWEWILDEMIFALKYHIDCDNMPFEEIKEKDARAKNGMRLFGLYFSGLWD